MFGGLTKTSSRIAIAAALGLTLGGYAMSTPAKAGGYGGVGGDCCADLEERVAELEATTVRKGNKKVSVTLSGWVVKSMNWWEGSGGPSGVAPGVRVKGSGFVVGDKDYDLGSRFAITGSATIAPGLSAGYNLTVNTGATTWGILSNQTDEFLSVNGTAPRNGGSTFGSIDTLYSYVYLKSDTYGALNWGHLSPASDNPAVLADISGTVIESNFVGFEGANFFLRPKGQTAVTTLTFNSFWLCTSLAAPGTDCFGTAQPAVRYDSPTWGGFRFETSYGTYDVVGPYLDGTPDQNFWDFAAMYNQDWGSWRISLAGAYTWLESAPTATRGPTGASLGGEEDIAQVGGTLMHVPSGLGVYATGSWESGGGRALAWDGTVRNLVDTDMWGIKPFWKADWWNGVGATILYGEYAQYNDFYNVIRGANVCGNGFTGGSSIGNFCGSLPVNIFNQQLGGVEATGSELERWGLGVVQEIDAAAMHVWLRWQHQELDANFVGTNLVTGRQQKLNTSFEDFDFFQAGGIIFF